MTDPQGAGSLPADAGSALRDARTTAGLPAGWRLGARLTTVADVAVVEVRDGGALAAVLKLARTPAGDESLALQQATLRTLAADERLAGWRRLLPEVLASGVAEGRGYSVERAVQGAVGTALPPGAAAEDAARAAVRAVAGLHRATGRAVVASPALVESWLQPGLSLLARTPMLLGPARRQTLVERLRERLHEGLDGRTVWVGRTHGDFFPGNVFSGPDGEVSGIIDWGQSRDDDAALIDPVTYVLGQRSTSRGIELGRVVLDLLGSTPRDAAERSALDLHGTACPADPVALDVAVLLAWLRHAENNLLKSPRYAGNPVWVRRNVEAVLKAVGR